MPTHTISRRAWLAGAGALAAAPSRYEAAEAILDKAVGDGRLHAAVLRVESKGQVFEKAYGKAKPDSVFLLASITKPMAAAGVMLLVDRGIVGFEDPAVKYLPGFTGDGREKITIRHLLTHTSGLPDMLPENIDLRKRNAPLSDFVKGALSTPLKFAPGTRTSYQSMGILLAAEIAERKTGKPFRDYLRTALLEPLRMERTALGLGKFRLEDTVRSQTDHAEPAGGTSDTAHWDWNSRWWRDLGAPWGGAHATAGDVALLLKYFLHPAARPMRPETARRMIANQNDGLNQPYGIGWSVTPKPFGHGGSTGTLCWGDPATDTTFVLLTSLPARVSQKTILDPVSKIIRADAR